MSLRQQITDELKSAMKQGQAETVSVLRLLTAAFENARIAKNQELTAEEELAVVNKEAKKRRESIEAYQKGGRQDLVDKEKSELKILEAYLPKLMTKEEIVEFVKAIPEFDQLKSNFGALMAKVMAGLKGKADGKLVAEAVKELT